MEELQLAGQLVLALEAVEERLRDRRFERLAEWCRDPDVVCGNADQPRQLLADGLGVGVYLEVGAVDVLAADADANHGLLRRLPSARRCRPGNEQMRPV